MKIRKGFVSNSSSSSFILKAKGETETVKDVARLMIQRQIYEVDTYEWIDNKHEELEHKRKLLDVLDRLPDDQAVQFFSTNYDTWIKKVANNIFISTCNNTSWDLPNQTSISKEADEELKKVLSKEDYDFISNNYDFYIQSIFGDFYSLPYEIKGTESRFDDWGKSYCKKKGCDGYIHLWKTKYGNICPKCDAHLFKRKEKIQKIEKNIENEKNC